MANPLLEEWTTPFAMPPFEKILPSHFQPAFEQTLAEHRAELNEIADSVQAPNFDNTIVALERSGTRLKRICRVFFNLASAHTNEELQEIEQWIAQFCRDTIARPILMFSCLPA